jgi:hypothetical protein
MVSCVKGKMAVLVRNMSADEFYWQCIGFNDFDPAHTESPGLTFYEEITPINWSVDPDGSLVLTWKCDDER